MLAKAQLAGRQDSRADSPLEKARDRGFGDWQAATQRCCTIISRQLNDIPYAVCQVQYVLDRRDKVMPGLSAAVEELKAIQAEFGDIDLNSEEDSLDVITEPITLEDVYLGPFRIAVFLDRLGELYHRTPYRAVALGPHPAAKDDAITHPHVSGEIVCEGDGAAAIRAALEEGRLVDFFTIVRSILTTYNPESPYVPLCEWEGIVCYECGCIMDGEDTYYCCYCDNAVCDACSALCAGCSETVCCSCAGACEMCEVSLCPQCAKTKCQECESVCCQVCMEDGLCPECREERNSDEQQETDESNESSDERQAETAAIGERLAAGEQGACTAHTAV